MFTRPKTSTESTKFDVTIEFKIRGEVDEKKFDINADLRLKGEADVKKVAEIIVDEFRKKF